MNITTVHQRVGEFFDEHRHYPTHLIMRPETWNQLINTADRMHYCVCKITGSPQLFMGHRVLLSNDIPPDEIHPAIL
jgi:hypothetical protein